MSYAKNTTVSAIKTRADIETLVTRAGATSFMCGTRGGMSAIQFDFRAKTVRFVVPLPDPKQFATDGRRRRRSPAEVLAAVEQESMRRWRALLLVVKAKLEAVATGIVSFEDEFLAHFVLKTGETFGQSIREKLPLVLAAEGAPDLLRLTGSGS